MRIFYVPELNQEHFYLDPEESKHLARVLRLEKGDLVKVTDGKGRSANAMVSNPDKNQAVLSLTGKVAEETFPGCRLSLGVAVTRHHDRFEWLLEKATEAGVYDIRPIECERSETRGNIKRSRWEKILLNAMKQSQRTFLPVLHEPVNFADFVKERKNGLIAWCGSRELPHLKHGWKGQEELAILIGPEGDFTTEEYELAKVNGYTGVNLGPLRLRTETAALTACILIKIAYEAD